MDEIISKGLRKDELTVQDDQKFLETLKAKIEKQAPLEIKSPTTAAVENKDLSFDSSRLKD